MPIPGLTELAPYFPPETKLNHCIKHLPFHPKLLVGTNSTITFWCSPTVSARHLCYKNRFSPSGAMNVHLTLNLGRDPDGHVCYYRAGTMGGAPQIAVKAEFLWEQRELQGSWQLAVCAVLVQLLLDAVNCLAEKFNIRIDSKTRRWKTNDET